MAGSFEKGHESCHDVHVLASKSGYPHTTTVIGLLQLPQSLGATNMSDLNLGDNAQYMSERLMQKGITSLGDVIRISIRIS